MYRDIISGYRKIYKNQGQIDQSIVSLASSLRDQ